MFEEIYTVVVAFGAWEGQPRLRTSYGISYFIDLRGRIRDVVNTSVRQPGPSRLQALSASVCIWPQSSELFLHAHLSGI